MPNTEWLHNRTVMNTSKFKMQNKHSFMFIHDLPNIYKTKQFENYRFIKYYIFDSY